MSQLPNKCVKINPLTSWYYSRVHKRGQAEVHNDEKCYDSLIERHGPYVLFQYVPLNTSEKRKWVKAINLEFTENCV